ncbi:MAG: ATP--guanido phosphotransferase [Clostridia bacterium]|nr:ATP--guanido phosphotransferase [Clostridia bacterium]
MSSQWIEAIGSDRDVVLSTRVSLTRNLADLPFPASMTEDQRQTLIARVSAPITQNGLDRLEWDALPMREQQAMAERHVVSPAFAAGNGPRAVFATADESVSVSVGERDHLKIKALMAGLAAEQAYARADELDTALDKQLPFAFDGRLGYLTQSPADLGTAMHVSVYLHLPALQQSRFIYELGSMVSKLGLSLHSVYGESGKGGSCLYQLSNRVTLGITEQAAISNLSGLTQQIVRQERLAREELIGQPVAEDRVWRSYGLMKYARLLGQEECRTLWSHLRLGVAQGLLPELTLPALDALLYATGTAAVMTAAGADVDGTELEKQRATIVRERL